MLHHCASVGVPDFSNATNGLPLVFDCRAAGSRQREPLIKTNMNHPLASTSGKSRSCCGLGMASEIAGAVAVIFRESRSHSRNEPSRVSFPCFTHSRFLSYKAFACYA